MASIMRDDAAEKMRVLPLADHPSRLLGNRCERGTRQLKLALAVYFPSKLALRRIRSQGGLMFGQIKAAALAACAVLLGSVVVVGQAPKTQQPPDAERASSVDMGKSGAQGCVGCELPIMLRQSVVAGKTAVGTKVEGQLIMATMMKGGVIPRSALISGEVIESVAKSGNSPSRLAIRMDSAQWKNGGVKFKAYLTASYYPSAPMAPPNLSYGPPGDRRNWGGVDPTVDTTDPPNPAQKLSTQDTGVNAAAPASIISKERVLMKNVESTRGADGSVVLVSSRSTIKLNKITTYVLAVDELFPGK
jgi:hypothetical protein